jgi:hypothetical protein
MRRALAWCALLPLVTAAAAWAAPIGTSALSAGSAARNPKPATANAATATAKAADANAAKANAAKAKPAKPSGATQRAVVLLGNMSVGPTTVRLASGQALILSEPDRRPGTAHSISVYVMQSTAAKTLIVRLYADKKGSPGKSLAAASLARPRPGMWNVVSIKSAAVRAGQRYWVSVQAKAGMLVLRTRATGSCMSEVSPDGRFRALPASGATAQRTRRCLSAYVTGTARAGLTHAPLASATQTTPAASPASAGSGAASGASTPTAPVGGPKPSISAVTMSNVTGTGATLTATVNPNGVPTNVAFQYGATTSYGLTTANQNIGSGNTPQVVTATVTGLTSGTTYHVRAVATQ